MKMRLPRPADMLVLLAGLSVGCAATPPPSDSRAHAESSTTLSLMSPEDFERATLADNQKDPESYQIPEHAISASKRRPSQSSDYSGPPLLTPEEFEKATAADKSEEEDESDSPPPLALRDRHASFSIVPAHAPLTAAAPKNFQITLRNDFIENYKNCVTLTTPFKVMGASAIHPVGSGGEDGDVHCGGTASEVGLPCVAEVMNASGNPVAAKMKKLAKNQSEVEVTGAWRLWCEHPGVPQIQDNTDYVGQPSNPNHVFELHPVVTFDGAKYANTIKVIPGYTAYDAITGFRYYESVPCKITTGPKKTTTIMTPQAKYNYVEFRLKAEEDTTFQTIGGHMVRVSVLDDSGKVIVKNRRMAFISGTDSDAAATSLKAGDQLHVLGIPRIDLAEVSWRARESTSRPEVLTWNLPYEIIVVGVYGN